MPVTAMLALSYDSCVIACYNGEVYRTADGGDEWVQIPSYATEYEKLYRDVNGTVWAVGKLGTISRMDSAVTALKLQYHTDLKAIHGIRGAPGGAMFAVGSEGAIFRMLPSDEKR
jgi:photosystem II stability/assembly factor-like uncharacterized protein